MEEWIFLKIYINPISSDLVISRYLLPIALELSPDLSQKWFFLRYRDPEYHIRLRFWFSSKKNLFKGLSIIQKHLGKAMMDAYVHHWSINSYQREIERYGIDNILETEKYFHLTSEFIAKSINLIPKFTFTKNCFALWIMHNTLKIFIPDSEKRLAICRQNMQSYLKEYNISETSKKKMNDSYRRYRKYLDTINTDKELTAFPEELAKLMAEFQNKINNFVSNLRFNNRRSMNINSIIHLDINRIYQDNARETEMALYYILYKKYNSDKHRVCKTGQRPN